MARGYRTPCGEDMKRTIWIIASLVVLAPIFAVLRIEAGTPLVPATATVKWIEGGPNNPDLMSVSNQIPFMPIKH